ncbi:mitochondrial inner membrane protein MPV17 isoform X2 [Lycorma delicatula]|uniref:mitochondrial inner membrane protein MPV17 isoform X2 n=1 Tax=Lycorma delicatula TaxID=130591 RepID=UPI003F51467B
MNFYLRLMNKRPLPMQMLQSGFLMGTGDVIAQTCVEKKHFDNINWRRTGNYCTVGFLFVGPVLSKWYGALERMFGKNGIKTTLKKIAVDQTLFAPCFIPVIMSSIAFTEGKSVEDIKWKLQSEYFNVLFTNYKIWPFIQLLNFYFVPLNYRVIFVQFVAVGWNTYLSWKISSQKTVADNSQLNESNKMKDVQLLKID